MISVVARESLDLKDAEIDQVSEELANVFRPGTYTSLEIRDDAFTCKQSAASRLETRSSCLSGERLTSTSQVRVLAPSFLAIEASTCEHVWAQSKFYTV